MTRRAAAALAAVVLATSAVGAGAADPVKPEDPGAIVCVDDVCTPSKPDPRIERIPPDLPPAAKLRAQLAKERRAHRAEVRALRAELRALRGER